VARWSPDTGGIENWKIYDSRSNLDGRYWRVDDYVARHPEVDVGTLPMIDRHVVASTIVFDLERGGPPHMLAWRQREGRTKRPPGPLSHLDASEPVAKHELNVYYERGLTERFPPPVPETGGPDAEEEDLELAQRATEQLLQMIPDATKDDMKRFLRTALSRAGGELGLSEGPELDKLIESLTRLFPDRKRSSDT
jgi:hypothetical protein